MTKEELFEIAEKYGIEKCTKEELSLLENFYSESQKQVPDPLWSRDQEIELEQHLYKRIKQEILVRVKKRRKLKRISQFTRIAAVLIIASLISVFYVMNYTKRNIHSPYLSVLTGNGKIKKVILPDSSIVWLNALSKISYPREFGKTSREVQLQGEAFFKVTHHPKLPFIVKTTRFNVRVLGTWFTVSAYTDDSPTVVLEKGSIRLNSTSNKQAPVLLKPGEKAVFDHSNFKISQVDAATYSSWRDSTLNFNRTPLLQVAHRLSHWYGVPLKVEDPELQQLKVKASYKNGQLEDILKSLSFFLQLHYQSKNDTILLLSNSKKQMPM